MRNRYPGICYRCKEPVAIGAGHFERHNGGWRTQHANCAILHRGKAVSEHAIIADGRVAGVVLTQGGAQDVVDAIDADQNGNA